MPISKDDLTEIVEELDLRGRPEKDEDGWYRAVAALSDLHPGDFEKTSTIMFRMEAVTRLLEKEGATGWTLPLRNGAV